MRRLPAFLALVTALGAAPLAAQSLLATQGLGVPLMPLDARARALGSVPTGLFGLDLSMDNPADAADVLFRGGMATAQPYVRSDELAGERASTSGARFPLLRVLYPYQRFVFSLGYGSFLDQNWAVSSSGISTFAGETATVNDLIQSQGGISQLRLGASYLLSPHLAMGAAVGLYTGYDTRQVTRTFPDSSSSSFLGFDSNTEWGYHGPLASAGFRADIARIIRVAGAFTWSGTLSADSAAGDALSRSYQLPLQATAGASALLAPSLTLSVGGDWAGWSRTTFSQFVPPCTTPDCATTPTDVFLSRNTIGFGAGLEYTGTHSGVRTFPFRVGYHYAQLPFYAAGGVLPTEQAASAGAGLRIGGSASSPAAQVDAALERGWRSGGPTASPLSESYWRFTFSLAIFGR